MAFGCTRRERDWGPKPPGIYGMSQWCCVCVRGSFLWTFFLLWTVLYDYLSKLYRLWWYNMHVWQMRLNLLQGINEVVSDYFLKVTKKRWIPLPSMMTWGQTHLNQSSQVHLDVQVVLLPPGTWGWKYKPTEWTTKSLIPLKNTNVHKMIGPSDKMQMHVQPKIHNQNHHSTITVTFLLSLCYCWQRCCQQ